jgi:hypothetical protein
MEPAPLLSLTTFEVNAPVKSASESVGTVWPLDQAAERRLADVVWVSV